MLHDEMKKIKFGGPGFEVQCNAASHMRIIQTSLRLCEFIN